MSEVEVETEGREPSLELKIFEIEWWNGVDWKWKRADVVGTSPEQVRLFIEKEDYISARPVYNSSQTVFHEADSFRVIEVRKAPIPFFTVTPEAY